MKRPSSSGPASPTAAEPAPAHVQRKEDAAGLRLEVAGAGLPHRAIRLERLVQQLSARQRVERLAAIRALGKVGPEAVAPLCQALRDRDRRIQIAAVEALG